MMKDTPQYQTNAPRSITEPDLDSLHSSYWNAYASAKRIEELERHNAMMLDVLKELATRNRLIDYGKIDDAINANAAQSSEWLNKKHVEFMKSLPVAAFGFEAMAKDGKCAPVAWVNSYPKDGVVLVAIPSEE